jgi:dTDP-4-dehydrorhamnose 3,5-epimerase
MKFKELGLKGLYIVEKEPWFDERGYFERSYCKREFEKIGFKRNFVQTNISFSNKKHTLRGMHYQINESGEDKLVSCVKGKIMDVVIDMRAKSKTYCQHICTWLEDKDNKMLLVPRGFAHGFITLTDNCMVMYQVSNYYNKENERGVRWNDPFFNIIWPTKKPIISKKDANHPFFRALS